MAAGRSLDHALAHVFYLNNGPKSERVYFPGYTHAAIRRMMTEAGLRVALEAHRCTAVLIPDGASGPGEKLLRAGRGGAAKDVWSWSELCAAAGLAPEPRLVRPRWHNRRSRAVE